MFQDSQAKKFVNKEWRIILLVTKFFADDFFYQLNFMPTSFLPISYPLYILFLVRYLSIE